MHPPDSLTPAAFPTTVWTTIIRAGKREGPDAKDSLNRLLGVYWRPVYGMLRMQWNQSSHDAADRTQEFFLALLEDDFLRAIDQDKGRFRSFVKVALKHFMLNWIKARKTIKRGGQAHTVSIDAGELEARLVDVRSETPESFFDAQWRECVMAEALKRLKEELDRRDRGVAFEVMRLYDLEPSPDAPPTRERVAEQLGISSADVKQLLETARGLYRTCVESVIRESTLDRASFEEELRHLAGG